eukprot:jgi/Bigna1/76920/fgenesh1_pg.44_\
MAARLGLCVAGRRSDIGVYKIRMRYLLHWAMLYDYCSSNPGGSLYTPGPPYPSKGAISLKEVPRIRAGDMISLEAIFEHGGPVVIYDENYEANWNITKMKELCGHRNVSLISNATYTTLMALPEEIVSITEWFLLLLGSSSRLNEELSRRVRYPLSQYIDDVELQKAERQQQRGFQLPYIFRFAPTEIRLLFDVLLRPLYLHDVSLAQICPEIMADIQLPT